MVKKKKKHSNSSNPWHYLMSYFRLQRLLKLLLGPHCYKIKKSSLKKQLLKIQGLICNFVKPQGTRVHFYLCLHHILKWQAKSSLIRIIYQLKYLILVANSLYMLSLSLSLGSIRLIMQPKS